MHRHRHLFEKVYSLENMIAAGKAALRGKRTTPNGSVFLADFEKEVFTLHEELVSGSYRHGSYSYFTIYEPKQRVVAAAPFRDRVVHHAIVRVIEPVCFLLDQAGRRVLFNPRRFDRLDIMNAFPRNQAVFAELLVCATQDRERPSNRRYLLPGCEEGRLVETEVITAHLKRINATPAHV
jgi:hypothetical protein